MQIGQQLNISINKFIHKLQLIAVKPPAFFLNIYAVKRPIFEASLIWFKTIFFLFAKKLANMTFKCLTLYAHKLTSWQCIYINYAYKYTRICSNPCSTISALVRTCDKTSDILEIVM